MATDRNASAQTPILPRILLTLLLLILFWRLLDFIDEALSGSLKMSLGPLLLTGSVAAIAQLVVIILLLLLTCRVIIALRPAPCTDAIDAAC
jgi:hypothetical protein